MDRLQSMRVFAKVVEQGSFVRAAELLDISNAVATRFIADLEAHLGTRLLNRSTRRLSLTEAGQAYLERVHMILAEVDDAEALVSMETKRPAGTLAIYSNAGFGQSQLGEMLAAYAGIYPDVGLDVYLSDRSIDLVEEGIDIGFFSSMQKFDASMIVRQLGVAKVILCASPAYLERAGAPAQPEDLSRHSCLNFSHEYLRHHWHVNTEAGVMDVPIVSKVVSNSGVLLRDLALAGMGIVLRPSYSLGDDLRCGKLVQVLPGFDMGQVVISMVYPSRRLLSAKVRSFADFISARFPHPETDPWLT
ncbi:LysR family transcriptional regulator [Herbaspirillum huttiense]|jgi:DNA-binding transcriptional LysR family regulator|uniref:LysR family transcriptional regulator n=3 Tax=Herbaspirillum huttiense TaxID=863372 RepID=A0AAJ2H7Y8_9BURK|nr:MULTISPECIES: LysR family transcriptional regulator [Herbaspirillum]MAF03158.1 LysR family transcriptional regulator [Herbaspirillum sp.]MBN9356663.1 LysR family transcriptional regulator [Herbaspirillum huttiense]MBO17472.1 LysR family transcriptional regulator [Herbaspirillum sp.]MBP1313056.1 DNA-binding transcriptional LysR family regulator [Herbaspirillum sp. 1130]MCO4856700.1 LysR family transcriptional regulator [Herbaspirillum sp. WGmk3]